MDMKKLGFIAIALLSALVFYQLYQNTMVHWDGYAVEVDAVTGIDTGMLIPIEATGLQDYPLVAAFLDQAPDGTVMVTEVMGLEQLYDFLRSRGLDLGSGSFYLEHGGGIYSVTLVTYGGLDDQPLYIYLSGFMAAVDVALTVEMLRHGKQP